MPLLYPPFGPSVLPERLESTTLQLLKHPLAFTQRPLLRPNQFIKEAKKRGTNLSLDELELFHRRRILQPFYEIHSRPIAGVSDAHAPAEPLSTSLVEARVALAEGRLSDPAQRPYYKWPGRRSQRSLWYSYHQLPLVRYLPYWQARLQTASVERSAEQVLQPLRRNELQSFARQRSLAIALEILTPNYLPQVIGVIRSTSESDWSKSLSLVNETTLNSSLGALGVSHESLVHQADVLLATARQIDPLGKWSRVARIGRPRLWDELRYDALIAQEHRIGAEILLRFVDDLVAQGLASPMTPLSTTHRQPQHDRLSVTSRERSETIMDFELNNRPLLVLAVEGATECLMVNRVLDLIGLELPSSDIAVVNLKGVEGDVNLLARAVAVPHLDPDGHRGARLLSPLTSLMIVTDPEGRYKDSQSRTDVRTSMIDSVIDSLPMRLRTDAMRSDLEYLIHVRCWPEEFEFAHWSDNEIANSLQEISSYAANLSYEEVRRRVTLHRERRDNLRNVWSNWRPKPTKIELAERLWPKLESRIRNHDDYEPIPILEMAQAAIDVIHRTKPVREMAPRDDA